MLSRSAGEERREGAIGPEDPGAGFVNRNRSALKKTVDRGVRVGLDRLS
jgi:hypothetical protein